MSKLKLTSKYTAEIKLDKGVVKIGQIDIPIEKIEKLNQMIFMAKKADKEKKKAAATQRRANAFRGTANFFGMQSFSHKSNDLSLQDWGQYSNPKR